jgi:hypothetical protein
MYRSHTRLGLYLDQDDQALIQNYFPGPNQVYLLVRPHASKTSVGGFFFWEEGTIHRQSTYLEFPFSRAEILKRMEGVKREEAQTEAAPAVHAPQSAAPMPVPPAPEPRPRLVLEYPDLAEWGAKWIAKLRASPFAARMRTVKWRPVGIAALVLLGIAGLEYELVRFFSRRAPAPTEADYAPALRIERNGDYLQVNWNRNAPSILQAKRAVLEITDGGYSKALRLDPGQLRTGSVAYSPASDDVNFRLELVGANATVSESLRVVEGAGRPAAAQAPAPAPLTRPSPAIAAKRTDTAGSSGKPEAHAAKVQPAQPVRHSQPAPNSTARIRSRPSYDDGL